MATKRKNKRKVRKNKALELEIVPQYIAPTVSVPDIVVTEEDKVYENGSIAVEIKAVEKCNCKDYEGQDFFCQLHRVITECPKCHCVDAEREILGALNPVKNYACRICGIFYMRNMVSGDYIYS